VVRRVIVNFHVIGNSRDASAPLQMGSAELDGLPKKQRSAFSDLLCICLHTCRHITWVSTEYTQSGMKKRRIETRPQLWRGCTGA